MIEVVRTFTVDKPVNTVRDYLQDFSNAQEWDPGTISCSQENDGPVAVGTTWRNVSEIKGNETELTYRLAELEPNRLKFVGENKSATSTDDISLVEVPTGTEVTYHAQIEFHGIAKLASPFLQSEFEELGDKTAEQMTAAIHRLPS